jgi:hypothetical protein
MEQRARFEIAAGSELAPVLSRAPGAFIRRRRFKKEDSMPHHSSQEMDRCIDNCQECHETCLSLVDH